MIKLPTHSQQFALGQIVITATANASLSSQEVSTGLSRHAACDWGNVPSDDAALNNLSLETEGRLMSSYGEGDRRFWIITEWDRSVTTVLLPEDY